MFLSMKKIFLFIIILSLYLFSNNVELQSQLLNSNLQKINNSNLFTNMVHEPIVDSLYILGPGDELKIYIWGDLFDEIINVTVDVEMNITIPQMGHIKKCSNLKECKIKITSLIKEKTKDVNVIIELYKIRTSYISITGEITRQGSFSFQGTVRLSDLFSRVTTTEYASLRNIRITSFNGDIKTIDFLDFLYNGDITNNPYLLVGDRVFVPLSRKKISLTGAILRSNSFDYRKESLFNFIEFSGGLSSDADTSNIIITSYSKNGLNVSSRVLGYPTDCNNYIVQPDDHIVIGRVPYWHDDINVKITGRIRFPGTYTLPKESTIHDLFEIAGGILEDADLNITYLDRKGYMDSVFFPNMIESLDKYRIREITTLSSDEIFNSNFKINKNTKLQILDEDNIFVPKKINNISIIGRISRPGLLKFKEGQTVKQYIKQAGGAGAGAYLTQTRIFKRDRNAWIFAHDLKNIEAGDIIMIPGLPDDYYWDKLKDLITIVSGIISITVTILVLNN